VQGYATPATKKISTLSKSLVPRFFLQVVFFLCGPCTFQSGPVGCVLCLNICFVYALVAGGYQRGFGLALSHSGSLSSLLVLGRSSSGSFGLSVPFQSSLFRGLFFRIIITRLSTPPQTTDEVKKRKIGLTKLLFLFG
jgi:hypothetical protein